MRHIELQLQRSKLVFIATNKVIDAQHSWAHVLDARSED
jgi:hypothetical protein